MKKLVSTHSLAVLYLGILVLPTAQAAPPSNKIAHRVECPLEIPQASLPNAIAPADWVSSTRSNLDLHSVDLSDGPPSEMTFLKPDVITSKRKIFTNKWTKLDVAGALNGTWLACNYGLSNNVILGRKLDSNVSECAVTYTSVKDRRNDIAISCKW